MVANRWKDDEAEKWLMAAGDDPADQSVALSVYGARLIGGDRALVQHGGGNVSCKVTRRDIYGNEMRVLHVKGSGRDLAEMGAAFMPALSLEALTALRALDHLDDVAMINVMRGNMLDYRAPNPSVETLLHAFLPHDFINHTHASVMLALADLPNAAEVVTEIFGDNVATVPFYKPGFDLGCAAATVFEENPEVEGLILLNHGHFAFGGDAKTAYERIIRHTKMVEDWFRGKRGEMPKASGDSNPAMVKRAVDVLPLLRGMIGAQNAAYGQDRDAPMPVMDLRAGPNVVEFLGRSDLATLAARGVATPDHVIRTKNLPLYLDAKALTAGSAAIGQAVQDYVADYKAYFNRNASRQDHKKTLLNPAPNLAWIEGVGIVGMGADARAASIAADMAEENILAMTLGQDCGGFHPLNEANVFDMEYWSLEQAKLGHAATPSMTGRVVLVTGGGGAIGLATAAAFAAKGANIFLVDLAQEALDKALAVLGPDHGGIALDITAKGASDRAINACIARFGGLDILVSNAGAAWTGEMAALDDAVLRRSFELNFFAHQTFAKAAAHVFAAQGRGGQMLFNVSKQAVNPGKGFGAYGLPKAATFFLVRQLALELGPHGVRVNGINADRIRSGLLDDAFIRERAKARGIDEGTYMAGNLIRREVEARHVADAFVALAEAERTTAHVITVDGGNIEAALR